MNSREERVATWAEAQARRLEVQRLEPGRWDIELCSIGLEPGVVITFWPRRWGR